MKISGVFNNPKLNNSKISTNAQKKEDVSFKGIYIDSLADLGAAKIRKYPPVFMKKDALLLNEIAQQYPNQDCFIRKGNIGLPRLEYRERPPEVQVFDADIAKRYKITVDTTDEDYPCEPLILYPPDDKDNTIGIPCLNTIIGIPSFISLNPSLSYTVKAGFELHKKMLEKKMKIMNVLGNNDSVTLGRQSIMQKAHAAVREVEVSIVRYLVDSAYAALKDRASAKQIYESDYFKVGAVLDEKRTYDLKTSVAKQVPPPSSALPEMDICDYATKNYPNLYENLDRIDQVLEYMEDTGLTLVVADD